MTAKRKATYVRQKEEQAELRGQISVLQQQLADLQAKEEETEVRQLDAALGLNAALRGVVEQQQLGVATTQSLVSQWLVNQERNPMSLPIHLGREWGERRQVLLNMKDERIARGLRYVTARCQHLDALKPHFSEERFEDANGDFCCVRNEVIPFPGVQSLRKVFDAVKFTLDTLEITISEQLGHITVRDDYDAIDTDSFISNYRLVSGLDSGVTVEQNAVAFGQYFDNSKRPNGAHAVLTIDSVDQDDLHPYHPNEYVRKAINGTVVLIAAPGNQKNSCNRQSRTTKDGPVREDDKNTGMNVAMLRSFFVKTCRPNFEVSELAAQELQVNSTRWGDVVLQAVRRIVYA